MDLEPSEMRQASIFVSIPAYRDTEAQHTIDCLFATAGHPERVFVGVLHQLEDEDHASMFRVPYARPHQVRQLIIPAAEATGPCKARHLIQQQLYANQDYFLHFDSHMRTVQDWDCLLLEQWRACGDARAILSTYPAGYSLPDQDAASWREAQLDDDARPPFLVCSHFGPEGMPRFKGRRLAAVRDTPIPGLFCASGFCFGPGRMLAEGGNYDPGLDFLFFGEELLMAVRLWTHGWNFFAPGRHVVYHLWDRRHRPTFFAQTDAAAQARSLERVRWLLQGHADPFGCGTQRSVADYFAAAGIDLATRHVSERAQRGGLDEADFMQEQREQEKAAATVDAVLALLGRR